MKRIKNTIIPEHDTISGKKDDKVEVIDFNVKPLNPKPGKIVTISFTVKNVSGELLSEVPWQIGKDKTIFCYGERYNVPAGQTFKVSVTWTASAGAHFFYADIDPRNILKEPRIKQFNNFPQGIDVIVSKGKK
jgi:hypothetical protein